MLKNRVTVAVNNYLKPLFHKRKLIIVSEHEVKHISLSAHMQVCTLALVAGSICLASYSTGSYLAVRHTLKERTATLRSVTNARVETNFNSLLPTSAVAAQGDAHASTIAALSDPAASLPTLDNSKLFARIAVLEQRVSELQNTNDQIVTRVRSKTSGHIEDLEDIIRQTGLQPEDLSKPAAPAKLKAKNTARSDSASSEGGPYIPVDTLSADSEQSELYDNLDRLAMLRRVVSNLPLSSPINHAEEQSPFGHRVDPFTGHLAFHSGLDLAGPAGSQIYSTANGTVVAAGFNGPYGNCIDIDHGFGIVTRYGHLSRILVEKGQKVKKGDVIAIEGSTGRSTGPHLHYEVRFHDQPMNPKKFLTAASSYVSQD